MKARLFVKLCNFASKDTKPKPSQLTKNKARKFDKKN